MASYAVRVTRRRPFLLSSAARAVCWPRPLSLMLMLMPPWPHLPAPSSRASFHHVSVGACLLVRVRPNSHTQHTLAQPAPPPLGAALHCIANHSPSSA